MILLSTPVAYKSRMPRGLPFPFCSFFFLFCFHSHQHFFFSKVLSSSDNLTFFIFSLSHFKSIIMPPKKVTSAPKKVAPTVPTSYRGMFSLILNAHHIAQKRYGHESSREHLLIRSIQIWSRMPLLTWVDHCRREPTWLLWFGSRARPWHVFAFGHRQPQPNQFLVFIHFHCWLLLVLRIAEGTQW